MKFKNEKELQLDLAEYLRSCELLTFTEIELRGMRGRLDVVAVKPHNYANKDIRGYEVKLTKSCFQQDNKYENYLSVVNRLYFAAPQGVLSKEDIPDGFGLIVRGRNGWHVVKAPKRNTPSNLTADTVFSLLFRGYEESLKARDLRDRIVADSNATLKDQASKIGYEIAKRLDRDRETQAEEWTKEVAELFKIHLGIDLSYRWSKYKELPNIDHLKDLLKSVGGTIKEVNNIKKIGEYLSNLDLPEENEIGWNLKENRENALKEIAE